MGFLTDPAIRDMIGTGEQATGSPAESGKKPIYKLGPPKKSLAVRLNFGRVQKKVSCKATGGSPSPKLSQAPGTSRQGEPFPLVTRKPRSSTVRRPRLTVAPFNEKRVPDPAQASEPEGNDFLYILAQAGESLERDEKASEDRAGFCPPARPDKAGKLKFKEAKWKPKERFTTPPVGALTKSPDMQKIPATVNPKCTPEIPSNCKFVKPVKPQVKPTGKPPFKVTCSKPPSLCPVDPKNEAGKTIMMPQKNQTAQDKAAPHSAQANRAAHKAAATAAQPNPPPKPYSGASLKTQTGTPFKSQASAPIKTQPSTPTKTLSRTSSDSQMNTLPKKPLTRQPTIVAQTSERSKQTSDSSGESDEKRKATSMTRPSQTVAAIKTTVSSAEKSQELLDLKPIVPTSRGAWLETFGHTSGPASISPHTKNQPVENDLEDDDDSDVDDDDDEEEEDEDDDEGYALHGHSDSAIGSKRTGHFDEGDAKRIRRMEANREAARQTIRRRREQYDGMLSQEKKLEEDNAALCKDIEEVKSDIDMLTQNILWLRAAMKKIEDRRMEGKRWAAEARRAGEVEKRSDVLQQELEAQLRAEVHQRRMLEEHRASELRAAEDRICHPSSPQHFSDMPPMSVGMQQLAAMSGWPFPPGTGPNIPPWMTVPHHQGPTGQGFGPDLAALIASGALPQVFPGPNSSQGFGPPAFLGGMSPEEIQLLVVGPGNVPPVMNPWAMFPGMPPGMAAQLAAGHLPLPPSLHGIPPEMLAVLANGGLSPNELAAMAASGLPDHMMPPGISPSMAAAMAAMAGHPPPGIIPPGMVESKNGIHPCPTK